MSSNAALSAARRRRSNPTPTPTNMQPPPVNRIIQRPGVPPVQQQQQPHFTQQRMPPPPQLQAQMRPPAPPQAYMQQQQQQQQQSKGRHPQQPMTRPQSPGLPPLPPPVKTAGPLYGIPIHPLMMFKTHDNKLSEHELSIGDCFEQLKEIDERLAAFEASNGSNSGGVPGDVPGGDLNELMNDGAFINGIVDNIMNTTNFASIVENVIPLKEENEVLTQQVQGLQEQVRGLNEQVHGLNEELQEWKDKMQELEDRIHSICSSAPAPAPAAELHETDDVVCENVQAVSESDGEKNEEE
jgi:FtsZ-binding cell division protein ZapB